MAKRPDFFIVGAPKSGTTAMDNFLQQHPGIFMAPKEVHFFGKDLQVKQRISAEEYLALFSDVNEKLAGEASVWYLYSLSAASEIKAFSPDAKIIIMLRDPVELIYSLHSQHLYDGNEDVQNFGDALKLDDSRRKGLNQPASVDFHQLPPYIDSVLFAEQVKRYFDLFGKENVKVILYEEFVADTNKIVAETFRFLGVDDAVPIVTGVINSNKQIQNFRLHRLLKLPHPVLKKLVRVLIPSRSFRHRVMKMLFGKNIQSQKRVEMDESIRLDLLTRLRPEIIVLESVIRKDLSNWLE